MCLYFYVCMYVYVNQQYCQQYLNNNYWHTRLIETDALLLKSTYIGLKLLHKVALDLLYNEVWPTIIWTLTFYCSLSCTMCVLLSAQLIPY